MQRLVLDLQTLKDKVLAMASKSGELVNLAVKALVERDETLAAQVEADDRVLDDMEVELDDLAIALLSKAPLAGDLRLIAVVMKITQNLERVGDEATTISRRVRELSQEAQLKPYIDIPRMAQMALDMLDASIRALVDKEPEKARSLIPQDKVIDRMNKELHRELLGFMVSDSNAINRCLHLMVISKCLERIADHAANIAEEVVYLYEATDIRHTTDPAE